MVFFSFDKIKTKLKKSLLKWLLLFTLVLIWGTSFLLIKRGLEVYPNHVVGSLRIFIAFVVTLPFALFHARRLPSDKWKYIAIVGIFGTGIPALLFAKAQTVISSSVAGILNSLTPLFTLVTGILFFKQKALLMRVLGVITGLAGAVGLVYVTSNQSFEFHLTYALFIIVATVFYAFQSNVVKAYLNEVNPVAITTLGFSIIGIPAGIYLFFFSDFLNMLTKENRGYEGLGYVAILSVFGSVIALILYNRLVQMTNAVFATSLTYLIPMVALLWGLIDGENLPLASIAFIMLIFAGVIMVNKNDYLKKISKKTSKTFGS